MSHVPYPSEYTAHLKKWVMCEWEGNPTEAFLDAMVQEDASFDSLIETREYVNKELSRFYDEIGEDIVPLDQYVTGPYNPTDSRPNIIYDLPDEKDAPERVVLSKTTNGNIVFRPFSLEKWL